MSKNMPGNSEKNFPACFYSLTGKKAECPLFLCPNYLKPAVKCGMISINILIEGMNSYGNEDRSDKRGWNRP